MAARLGQDGIVRRLLRCGADKEALTNDRLRATPLHMAAAYGQRSVVELLLQAKADSCAVDSQGRVPARSVVKG